MGEEDERDFLAISEAEIFEEARDRLQIATDAESRDRTEAKTDLLFAEGEGHWEGQVITTASMETPQLTINLTDALVRRVVNNMKQQRPRGKAHPVSNGAEIEIAEVINGIGRHVEYRSEASVAYDTAGDMAVRMGWGYVRLVSEYVSPDSFSQDIRIMPIRDSFTVYMDPGAIMPTACDADWCLITILMKRTEYKRLYPKAENVQWNDVGQDERNIDWERKEEIRLAEYFRVREKPEKLYLLRNERGQEETRYEKEMPNEESLAAAKLTIVDERQSSRRQVEWFRLNGTKVVDRKILPGSWIPVVRCEGNAITVDGRICRRGMVRAMRDPQRMVDYGEVAKIRRLGLTPQAPWVGAEGQFDGHPEWDAANQQPYSKLVYKPVTVRTEQGDVVLPPPQRQPPAQIEAGFAEFVQGMRANLLAVAGMPNEPGADMQGQVVSGRAIQKRQNLSDQSHFQYYDNQTLMIAQVWRIMLEWIPHYFSEERMQRIIGEDGLPKMIAINQPERGPDGAIAKVKNDLTLGRYDVVMDTGPGYETKREEGAETLMDLVNSKLGEIVAQHGADLVFRSLDHPYMQELADRLVALTPEGLQSVMEQLPERAKSIVRALGQQVQQLQQALQQAQLENKYHLQAKSIESQTRIHDTNTRAATARADSELKAGVDVFIEGMKHGHETRMAERDAQTLVGESNAGNGSPRQ